MDKSIKIEDEKTLNYEVVKFIREEYPGTIISTELTSCLPNQWLRNVGMKKGYTPGTPDLIIQAMSGSYIGFAIELKTPKGTGVLSKKQKIVLQKLERSNYKIIVSNNYSKIIIEISKYMDKVKEKCKFWGGMIMKKKIEKHYKKCKYN